MTQNDEHDFERESTIADRAFNDLVEQAETDRFCLPVVALSLLVKASKLLSDDGWTIEEVCSNVQHHMAERTAHRIRREEKRFDEFR